MSTQAWVEQWERVPGYLDAPTMGLPPRTVVAAMRRHLEDWQAGRCDAAGFDEDVRRSRSAFATLVGVTPDDVAIGAQVSQLVGLAAASVPDGARIVVPSAEFASVSFPFLVHADRGVDVVQVPLEALPDALDESVHTVAFSVAQSADGRVADVDAILDAATRSGTRTVADLTQAAGWMPLEASRFDITVTGAYKWLCAPRGSAFLTARPAAKEQMRPLYPNWYASADIWGSIYADELALAPEVRRFDTSPAWPVWVGTAPALELLADLHRGDPERADAVAAYGIDLANRVRTALGLEQEPRPVLSLPDRGGALKAALTEAGCRVAGRGSGVRFGFHLWNTADDVARVVHALAR
ncbi:MAG TPA: aminotransferase class V-fold PLP-dependent enzyme [Marmoricola sp.]|nr:aminotransferase class V-fold PLP-dependent enzyme [Marmoricola sp.]